MEQHKSEKKTMIVDVGPQILPVYELFDKVAMEKAREGTSYVAIDCDKEELQRFIKDSGGKEQTMLADLKHLPFKNESVDQIWLMNVFSEFKNSPVTQLDGTKKYTLGLYDVFKELSRVLKKEGKIYIGETATPIRKVEWMADENYEEFGLEKKAYKGLDEVKVFLNQMGDTMDLGGFIGTYGKVTPFFLELTKVRSHTAE